MWYLITILISFIIIRYAVKTQLEYKDQLFKKSFKYGRLEELRVVEDNEFFSDMSIRFFTYMSIALMLIPFGNIVYSLIILSFALTTKYKVTKNNGRNFIEKLFMIKSKKQKEKNNV